MSALIREAQPADIERVLVPIRRFFDASCYSDLVTFDEASFRTTYTHLMTGDGVCIVAEKDGAIVGVTGALAYPFYFNRRHKTGQELFWWVNPEERGSSLGKQMFIALENWARGVGCKTFSMIALDSLKPDAVARMYLRAGYRRSEHSFIKEL